MNPSVPVYVQNLLNLVIISYKAVFHDVSVVPHAKGLHFTVIEYLQDPVTGIPREVFRGGVFRGGIVFECPYIPVMAILEIVSINI